MEQNPYQNNPWQNQNIYGEQRDLPNANLVLVLGICSIVVCVIGPILATIGLVISAKGMNLYRSAPNAWTNASYKQLNSGRTCSIIGLCTGLLTWAIIIFYVIWTYMMIAAVNEIIDASQMPVQ